MPSPESRPRRVGVREVAIEAGVSTQTVSRVINEYPHIRPDTRARVLAAMKRLDYRVNNAARALGTAMTRTIGIVASDPTLYGPSAGIAQLEQAARATGHWIATAYADASDTSAVSDAVDRLVTLGVDGLVVLTSHDHSVEAARAAAGGHRVAVLHSGAGAERQREGARAVAEHLLALGHRRIARVSGPESWSEVAVRDQGVDEALGAAGVTRGPCWRGDWSAASAAACVSEIVAALAAEQGPTAIVVANDQMALGLMAGLQEAGIRIPDEVSVVGFDDNPDAAYYQPALTTVRIDLAGEARRVIAEALGLPADLSPAPPVLIVRASTAPPPA